MPSILIIDDESQIREMLEIYIKRVLDRPLSIVHAEDGAEALRKVKNQDFDLIIVDIVIPKLNGLEVFTELKNRVRTKNIPTLVVSGDLQAQTIREAKVLGVKHLLAKPFNYEVFTDRLQQCLEN